MCETQDKTPADMVDVWDASMGSATPMTTIALFLSTAIGSASGRALKEVSTCDVYFLGHAAKQNPFGRVQAFRVQGRV